MLTAVAVVFGATLLLILNEVLQLRKVIEIMSENIASNELVKTLARAVVNAQNSEADAKEARAEAQAALADLQSKVELDDEAKELVAQALGNAVHAPVDPGEPVTPEPTPET